MPNPLVSVIIPSYKAAKYIRETIESVLNQSYKELEILVVDDGSPDEQQEVIERLSDKDNRVQYFKKENGGVSRARNFGLRRAQGEYVAFLDSDDLWHQDFLKKRIELLTDQPQLIGAASDVSLIDEKSESLNTTYRAATTQEDLLTFNPNTQSCPSSYLYRKEMLEKHDLAFHPELFNTADRFFLHEVLQHSKIGYIKGGTMYYRILSQSMSRQITPKLLRDYEIYLRDIERKQLLPSGFKAKYKSRFFYTCGAYSHYLGEKIKAAKYISYSFLSHPSTCLTLLRNRSNT